MVSVWQPSLFGLGRPEPDLQFSSVKRIALSEGAWVDHGPEWLSGHSVLFEILRDTMEWRTETRWMYDREVVVPRALASPPQDGVGHPVLGEIQVALMARYGVAFDRVSMALYRDGDDSVAMHGDTFLRDREQDSLVATVSVGARRRFLMKPAKRGPSVPFTLGWGDLIVMGGSCQRTWRHGVPKVKNCGPRLAIIFRTNAFQDEPPPPVP